VHSIRKLAPSLSDADLVLAARTGELWAREALFKRHVEAVYGLAFRLLGPHCGARDVLHSTFVGCFSTLSDVRDPSAFRASVLRLTVRLVRRRLERARWLAAARLAPAPDFEAFQSQLAATTSEEVTTELGLFYQLVELLPPRQRMAFVLRRIDGLSAEEIGGLMGVSAPRVRRWLANAQRHIGPLRGSLAS